MLTVRQPCAWQIVHENKGVENRLMPVGSYRGPVAIHAGRQPDSEAMRLLPSAPPPWVEAPRFFDYGAVIGVAHLVDVHDASWCGRDQHGRALQMCSPWSLRAYQHLVLVDAVPLPMPILVPDQLGIGLPKVDDTLAGRIAEQLGW